MHEGTIVGGKASLQRCSKRGKHTMPFFRQPFELCTVEKMSLEMLCQVCLEEVLPTCAPVKKQECKNVCQDVCQDIYWCKVCA